MQPKQSRINQKSLVLKHKASSARWSLDCLYLEMKGGGWCSFDSIRAPARNSVKVREAASSREHNYPTFSLKTISKTDPYSSLNRMSNSQSVFCVYCNGYNPETKLIYILTCICSEKALKVHFQSKEQFHCSQIFNSKCLMQLKNLVKDNQYITNI